MKNSAVTDDRDETSTEQTKFDAEQIRAITKENIDLKKQIMMVTERLNKLESKPTSDQTVGKQVVKKPKVAKIRRIASLSPKRLEEARKKPAIWRRVQLPKGHAYHNPQPIRKRAPDHPHDQVDRRRQAPSRSHSRRRSDQPQAVNNRSGPSRSHEQSSGFSSFGARQGRFSKSLKRSRCPFCETRDCEEPVECALRMPWKARLDAHRRYRLCPERRCFKTHFSYCTKKPIECDFCDGEHHRIWCKTLAKRRNLV